MLIVSAISAGRDDPSTSIVLSEVMRTPPPSTGSTDLIFCRKRMREPAGTWPGEAHPVRAVIEPARALFDPIDRRRQPRHQRERQIAVGDRLAAGHLALGALDIDMDPLMIAGCFGEFVDDRLIDREPIADADLLADKLREIRRPLDLDHIFSLFDIGALSARC